jgi:excisionase family DNA binding protein
MNNLLTKHQVAALLKIDIATLNDWARKGKIKSIKINTRGDRRYRQEDIDEFLRKGEEK